MKIVVNEHYQGPLLVTEPSIFMRCSFSTDQETPITIRTDGRVSFYNMECLTDAKQVIYVQHPDSPSGVATGYGWLVVYEEGAAQRTIVDIIGAYVDSPSRRAALPQPSAWVKFKNWLRKKLS